MSSPPSIASLPASPIATNETIPLRAPRATLPAPAAPPRPRRLLSQRVFALQQIVPLVLLAMVMFYEVTSHLILEAKTHPLVFAVETLVFGVVGPAFTWLTLHWVGHEIAKRERAEGEADALNAVLLEMHHRIKNNLQTVADLLSLEMSRNPRPEAQESLRDSITRIKSIAASHELLSVETVGSTNITELAQRVSETARHSMTRPDQRIQIRVVGPNIHLGSKQATAFALVLNELVSNAIEHGFRERATGNIQVELDEDGMEVWVRVQDDGVGLPSGFDLQTSRGLGLQIARTLAEKDLDGRIVLTSNEGTGATAWVLFQRGVGSKEE